MCTIFTITKKDRVFYGNNEDNKLARDETFVAFIPAQKIPSNWIFPGTSNKLINFGFMLVGVRKKDKLIPQGGMNSYGLAFDINGLPHVRFKGIKGKPWKWGFNYFDLLMTNRNISEVIHHFQTHEQAARNWGAGQIHFADASGKAVIIGVNKDGELGFTFKEDKDYLLSTNFNLLNPDDNCPGYPCQRYEKASQMLKELTKQSKITVNDCSRILDAVKVEYGKTEAETGTVYSNIFDLVKKEIYLYHLHDFSKPKKFDLNIELKQGNEKREKCEYTFADNAVEERFIFERMKVHVLAELFS